MNLPDIDPDDLFLFGSLALMAIGAAVVTVASTGQGWLAFGVALIVFGLPAFLVTFMAAGETE